MSRVVLLVALASVLIGVPACGGDDDGGGDAAETATTAPEETNTAPGSGGAQGAAKTVDVSLSDFEIDPARPRIGVGRVSFRVKNDGATPHNLEVEGPGGEAVLPNNLAPGQTGTLNVDLSKPGKYEWYCPVGQHRDFGMEGEITVRE